MKTLREYIDRLDEISRRDFLKTAGAAAVGAAIGSPKDTEAEWLPPIRTVDPMTDKSKTYWSNASVDRKFILQLTDVSGYGYKTPMLRSLSGKWKMRPAYLYSKPGDEDEFLKSGEDFGYGRLRIDNTPAVGIAYAFPTDSDQAVYIVSDISNPTAPNGQQIRNMIVGAKERILIDASDIGHPGVIQFNIK